MFQAPIALGRTVLFQDSPVCSGHHTPCELSRGIVNFPVEGEEGLTEAVALPQVNRSMHHADRASDDVSMMPLSCLTCQWLAGLTDFSSVFWTESQKRPSWLTVRRSFSPMTAAGCL